ncbi:ATPase ATP-binding domain-containing protein [Candidatus Magnetoovum chiemensis]|nr:ATPase ATP-binding domain-containing protein [Candidatus Magnetoovum chiemensis]
MRTLSGEYFTNLSKDMKILSKDGSEKWIRIYWATVDYKGRPTGLINIIDVTERKKYEQELKEKTTELEELNRSLAKRIQEAVEKSRQQEQLLIQQSKMASMGEMIGSIAHQWRQPLNTLALIVQDIQDAHEYGELNTDYVNKAVEESMSQINFMSKTIDDFRDFFTPTKTKQIFNVINSIFEVLSIISAQLKSSHIAVKTEFGKDMPLLHAAGYPNEFKQVVLNIITNAKDAIVAKRQVGGFNIHQEGRVDIAAYENNNSVIITICDNGGGIGEDIIDRIFDC